MPADTAIVVIDDNPRDRKLLDYQLAELGFNRVVSMNFPEDLSGYEKVLESGPNKIICDTGNGVRYIGLDVARELILKGYMPAHVIGMSGSPEVSEKWRKLGCPFYHKMTGLDGLSRLL